MSEAATPPTPLRWQHLVRPDGVAVDQALARNNSWYLVVPAADGSYELRYASQSANAHIISTRDIDDAKRAAETHADRYDTRA
jgi:hypothetical protein